MNIQDLTEKKNSKQALTKSEINFFVKNFCNENISEEEATEFIRAIYNNGLTLTETTNLTLSMAHSGDMIDLSSIGECVDKHSTGGVSDTTSLIVIPLLASLGVKVAKMSGRSLGWTGGTADKVEVFDGYRNNIPAEEFLNNVKTNGASLICQSKELAPADKKIYALRDKTGLVDNIALIASSIMSKKIACGAKVLLLDVKYGNGAFMQKLSDAKKLAKVMVKIGNKAGIKTGAVISNMNEPLSCFIGNNLEVYSAVTSMTGRESNLLVLSKNIVAIVLKMVNKTKTIEEGLKLCDEAIKNKNVINKFKTIIACQGGDTAKIDNVNSLLVANKCMDIVATKSGYLSKILCKELGNGLHEICAQEQTKEEKNMCGILLKKMKNEFVNKGDVLATINYSSAKNVKQVAKKIKSALKITKNKGKEFDLIKEIILK